MFPRLPRRLAMIALFAGLAACHDQSTQPQSSFSAGPPDHLLVTTTCKVTQIYQIVTWLTPLRNAPLDLRSATTLLLMMSTTQQSFAQQLVLRLAASLTPDVIAQLSTPPNPPYATKEAAVAVLVGDLMQCVGIPPTQAPPPGAYLPTGGLKVIGDAGGQLVANDLEAGIDVPSGAVTGPHLFAIALATADGTAPPPAGTCLLPTPGVLQVGRCYDLSVSPDVGSHASGQGFGGNGVFVALCSPGAVGQEVHTYLELAKADHGSLNQSFTIYGRQPSTFAASALQCNLGDGPPPPTASLSTKLMYDLASLVRPLAPTELYASDGVGSFVQDFTRASLVYRTLPMTVTPPSATVLTTLSQSFSATGPRPGPFIWSVNGADVGSDGFTSTYGTLAVDGATANFTAPDAVPTPATFNVCIRRAAAPLDRGCAAVTIQGNFLGSWVGTITNGSLSQPTTLNVNSQDATSATGELLVATNQDPNPYNTQRAFTGTVAGENLTFSISPFVAITSIAVSLTRSGNTLTGTMTEIGGAGRTFAANLSRNVIIPNLIATGGATRSRSRDLIAAPTSTDLPIGRTAP